MSYRTVALYITLIFVAILAVLYLMYPERFANVERKFRDAVSGAGETPALPVANQARFVNLDGKVEVKKVNSVKWVTADNGTTLNKGDLIQTGGDGVARITFPDGSTYTVKPDTLITVEENTMAQDRSTRVGVHISSGAVDLATSSFEVANSKAEVSFENARASVRENSRVAVRSDPESQQHEITVAQGQAELQRGTERVELGRFERISFPTGGAVSKARVIAPPELVQPVHLQPITVPDPKRAAVHFEWRPVAGAAGYLLSVSTSSMFTNIVAGKRTIGTSAEVSGLEAGDYFWSVKAVDAQKQVSEPSETFKFSLFAEGKSESMLLEVATPQVHGNLVEIVGRTEPGATLMIGGQPVGNIQPDGTFRHFTPPLPRGSHEIVVMGQNRRGGTAIRRVKIVIQ
ncbi:MAG: FecR domain-containing protein [Acidobacteria bacterium]|nr:FecR domain-containing protein [Acidobacteriota bacterium]MBI3661499.1 FecR domain-containing protein [Acidobacteriota bacterium]